ncbi:MAG: hypothetical protein NTZ94_05120 [Verrucomicrobia bacterium]|nr:hypothetical protein [Verrucomicrobiota bacterium]
MTEQQTTTNFTYKHDVALHQSAHQDETLTSDLNRFGALFFSEAFLDNITDIIQSPNPRRFFLYCSIAMKPKEADHAAYVPPHQHALPQALA